MLTYVMCSWCHGTIGPADRYCPNCGHDRGPRMDCQCDQCRGRRGVESEDCERDKKQKDSA